MAYLAFEQARNVSGWRSYLPQALLIVAATFWIYGPALHGGWLLDDSWYFPENPLLQNIQGLGHFWFQPGSWIEYYPIEETVMWAEWQLWGNDTLGYHLVNVLLHLASAFLVWRLLSKFGLRMAWLGGLIFAIHPAQIESVATISELKNTLSLPPFLLAMCAWIDYEERGRNEDYQAAFAFFLVAMLCKISMAAFPAIILLYAWWKRGQIQVGDLRASAPFWAVSLVLGFMTVWAGQHYEAAIHGQADPDFLPGFLVRLTGSGLILAFYFTQSILPLQLDPYHAKWTVNPSNPVQLLPWPLFAGVIAWLWIKGKSWGKHVLLGLGFFVLNLVPFLGFHGVSYMYTTWVFEHLLYIPIIGLIGIFVAGLENLRLRFPLVFRFAGTGFIALGFFLMAWEGHAYARLFASEEVLWATLAQRNPGNWMAQHDLGCTLGKEGRFPEALAHLQEAARLKPDADEVHLNLGLVLGNLGRTDEAEAQYRLALSLNPQRVKTYLKLGELLLHQGRRAEAETVFHQGETIAPDNAALALDLGGMLLQSGRAPEAIALFEQAAAAHPDSLPLRFSLGLAQLKTGHLADAIDNLSATVKLAPQSAPAQENLGSALAQSGDLSAAIERFQAAIALDPAYVVARENLGLALAQSGRISEAIGQFQAVLTIQPDNAVAKGYLSKLQALQAGGPAKL